jgi:hypothetical protein
MADTPGNTILSRRKMLAAGLASLAPAVLAASTAEAKKPRVVDEHWEFLRAQLEKLLMVLGRAESEQRITYSEFGSYGWSPNKQDKNSGRFTLDLEGDDFGLFLSLIAVGCVVSGHRTAEQIVNALESEPEPEVAQEPKTIIWDSVAPDGKRTTVYRRKPETALSALKKRRNRNV